MFVSKMLRHNQAVRLGQKGHQLHRVGRLTRQCVVSEGRITQGIDADDAESFAPLPRHLRGDICLDHRRGDADLT